MSTIIRPIRAAVTVAAVLILLAPLARAQHSNPSPLFMSVGGETVAASETPTTSLRQRVVRIDLDDLEATRVQAFSPGANTLRLNLFDDAVFEAAITNTGPTSAGYWLSGHLIGQEMGSVTLVVNGEIVAGTVRATRGRYEIRSVGNGVHAIRQLDPAALVSFENDFPRPVPRPRPRADAGRVRPIRPPAPSATRQAEAPPEENGARIDVLVVYTPVLLEEICYRTDAPGGRAQVEALVDLFAAETNQAYAESGVIQRVNIAGLTQVDYVESSNAPDADLALRRLVDPNDGYLDEVHGIRDRYSADIVILLICSAGGRAAMVPQDLSDPTYAEEAFAAVGHQHGSLTFAHELGHLMGLHHGRYDWFHYDNRKEPRQQNLWVNSGSGRSPSA